jgi:hypothetical protein
VPLKHPSFSVRDAFEGLGFDLLEAHTPEIDGSVFGLVNLFDGESTSDFRFGTPILVRENPEAFAVEFHDAAHWDLRHAAPPKRSC